MMINYMVYQRQLKRLYLYIIKNYYQRFLKRWMMFMNYLKKLSKMLNTDSLHFGMTSTILMVFSTALADMYLEMTMMYLMSDLITMNQLKHWNTLANGMMKNCSQVESLVKNQMTK